MQDALRDVVAEFAESHGIRKLEDLYRYYTPTERQRQIIEQETASLGSFTERWAHAFVSDKLGEATTHWRKLEDRVRRGVGNPCPLLLIGIPREALVP